MASTSSSSSSVVMASSNAGDKACSTFDVFLSFSGEDTRHSFTDHLYHKLIQAGIHTFRDNEEINKGEQLQPEFEMAIKASRASIVVLSKNYATSTWCLDELVLILEQRRECNHFVLPVFYGVQPTDVRNQKGTFAIQVKPSSKWTDDNVSKWKTALKEVADLAGEVVLGPETSILKKVVDTVYDKLDGKEVSLPPNITGMETHYKKINSWLEQCNVPFLAINGMGGSGKTTLAKYIYNSNQKYFEYVSFVEDIGSKWEIHNGLLELQEQLMKDMLGGKRRTIPCVSRGTYIIAKELEMKKALIVFDDIVMAQLVLLLGNGKIHEQSKIIITTRENTGDWPYWSYWRCQKYEMMMLNDVEASELLCRHAFGSKTPMVGFEKLVLQAVQYCEGNPLALEVLGSSLFKNNIENWASQLRLLEREIDSRVQGVLIRSYMSLPNNTLKKLFLHIACFFISKDRDYVVKILEPDYAAISGIKTLINRCLLSVSPNKKLIMHRLVQEMGKHIVREESNLPAKRSRVWLSGESYSILKKRRGSKTVEGLVLDMKMLPEENFAYKSSELNTDALNNMDILKLLKLNFVELSGSYENFSEDLRWLCWHGFHLRAIPSGLYMRNLVAIDMSCSNLEVFDPPTVLKSLRILNLKDSHNLTEIRNIFKIPRLETLVLWNCNSLVYVCEKIGDLTSLALLDMTGCNKLFNMEQLDPLSASTSGGVAPEQTTFSLPTSLHRLFLKDCHLKCTVSFPLDFRLQLDLKYLNLGNSQFESLPYYDHLNNLRVLDLSFCSRLKCLLCLPSTLAELYIFDCASLIKINFQSHRFTLQEFGYEGCINLNEVEGFIKLVPIAKLDETDLGDMKWLREYQTNKVCLVGDELTEGRTNDIQMLYEFGIMSTSLPDINDPNMTPKYRSNSSSLSFDVPLCPKNKRLKGINVTFKYELLGDDWVWFCKISTTNGVDLNYNPKVFGKPEVGEVCIWLSYWEIGEKLNTGDTVHVYVEEISGLIVHECGVNLVYADKENGDVKKNNAEWEVLLGGDLSRFKLSTGAFYLCRRDFFELMEVGKLTRGWFRHLFGDTIDHTEVRGWRKTGSRQVNDPLVTELKFVRCIIHGPQLEDIYKIAEMSKSSIGDKTTTSLLSLLEGEIIDDAAEDIYVKKSMSGDETVGDFISTFDDITIKESDSYSHRREREMEVERESVKLNLTNELIKEACFLSMKAHSNQHYVTNTKKHGAASSSTDVLIIIAFKGSIEADDFYHDDHFGETDVDCTLFPSLRRIGEAQLAKVNGSALQKFQDLLINSGFKSEVEKAVKEDKKILFTGHSSGGAIASLAMLWMLDEYTRKRRIRLPIGCVTFGSPLIGDVTLTHAVQREKWAGHFTHYVMQHDIVPRMMLAPKSSVEQHLPDILKFFKQKVNHATTKKSNKITNFFDKKMPETTIDHDQLVDDNQAVSFFENVLFNASTVASHDAFDPMEPTNSLKERLPADFVKVSPYKPFGVYVFCTQGEDLDPATPKQQLVVENPNAVLQLLFYFLQLPNEDQDLAQFALQSLNENSSYEEELNENKLQLETMVDLKQLNEHLFTSNGDEVRTRNKALFELTASAKWCLLAVEKAEKRKKENEDQVKESMKNYKSHETKNNNRKPKIIEDMLDEILKYKEKHGDGPTDYYVAFKLQNDIDQKNLPNDFVANVNRLEQAKIWDVIVEMVMRKDLPDEFEVWDELVDLGTRFRRLYEPLDIANYYRHSKGDDTGARYMAVRPKRYKFTQRWYEHANVMSFESDSESNFVAEVEELIKEATKPKNKTIEQVKKDFESIKNKVDKWKLDKNIAYEDVFWGGSVLSKLQEKLTEPN